MTKDDILALFEDDGIWAADDGNIFHRRLRTHAKALLSEDRFTLVEALREWLLLGNDPRTTIAANVAGKLRLKELRPDIEALRDEISDGKASPHLSICARSFDDEQP